MERTKLAAVVPADLGWSDVGSWSTVWDLRDHDQAGNATEGPVVMLDSHDSLVRSEDSVLTTVVGLDDVIVVSTSDAVLVSARGKAEQVKTLVEQLKGQNHRAAVEHRRLYRPWGYCAALPRQTHRGEAGQQALADFYIRTLRALGRREGNGRGHGERRRAQRARERVDLYPHRQRPSARQSRQDPARIDRGASWQPSRRGRLVRLDDVYRRG